VSEGDVRAEVGVDQEATLTERTAEQTGTDDLQCRCDGVDGRDRFGLDGV